MNEKDKVKRVLKNIEIVKENIKSASKRSGQKKEVHLIIVTKNQPKELVAELIKKSPGLVIAENRTAEANLKKTFFDAADLKTDDYTLHFIGRLQTNKIKDFLAVSNIIHSLDRWSLISQLEKKLSFEKERKNLPEEYKVQGFLQLNVSGEEVKAGFTLDEAIEILPRLADFRHMDFIGLMTMAPFTNDMDVVRDCFSSLRQARDRLVKEVSSLEKKSCNCLSLDFLSMGMTNDYIVAVEEGATHVRVGSAIFDFS